MPLTRLGLTDHPAAAWAAVEPWLRAHGTNWRERRAVLVPDFAWAAALKARAVEAGLPAMGLAWFTPGRWRAHALRARPGPPLRVALREDLHLLLELAAAQLPDNPLARAYGPDPATFQELLDTLDGAGWEPSALADPAARELAAVVVEARARAGWSTSAAADRALRETAAAGALPLLGERLLAVGFGPADWNLRPLLEAAAIAYGEAEFIFDVLDLEQPAAAAWVGVWEEIAGPAEWLEAPAAPAPFAPLAAAFLGEMAESAAARHSVLAMMKGEEITENDNKSQMRAPVLGLAEDLQAEAALVVAQALAFLGENPDGPPPRIGLVVGPANSPLAREVAARLAALDWPCHDALGHAPARPPAQRQFEAWLDWQENGRLGALVAWMRVQQLHAGLPVRVTANLEQAWQTAAAATLSDDPVVLAAWLRADAAAPSAAAAFFDAWPRLPETAGWDEWMEKINPVAAALGWPGQPGAFTERAAAGRAAFAGPAPRAAVLRWVRAVTRVPGRTRAAPGREPFAPLQIVDAAGAAAQAWTHLVLAGLQHGEWPADDDDSPLLDEARVAALNREVWRQGSQGEGHSVVAPGRGLLLSASARRALGRAGFGRLLGLPTAGLALTARRADPADGRPGRLSEFFWSAATLALGRMPSDTDWDLLRENTCDWLAGVPGLAPPAPPADLAAPARAYNARRDPATAFDIFSFCLAAPPAAPLRLSCKAWEEAVARPGAAWFKQVLRVEPRWDPATDDATALAIGSWAHRWARPGPPPPDRAAATPLPALDSWLKIAADRAQAGRAAATAAFAAAGRVLPEAWLDAWTAAGRAANQWISALAPAAAWPQACAEAPLPRGLATILPWDEITLPLTGQPDLVLLSRAGALAPGGLAGAAAWLVDFKTGADKPLSVGRLAKGAGLQLALYALALRALGAESVELTLLGRDAEAAPQLTGADLADPALDGLWQWLAAAAAGRWGEFHDLADRHARPGKYPLATLPVPPEILRVKWARTHPYFI